jgi:hypothetical protein
MGANDRPEEVPEARIPVVPRGFRMRVTDVRRVSPDTAGQS